MSFQQNCALLSLFLKEDYPGAADYLKRGAMPADTFTRFIEHHHLQLYIFSLLDKASLRPSLPQSWVDKLETFARRQRARQETMLSELIHLAAFLADAGLEFILLKGPYLAERFFGGIDRREFADLDILIRRENLATAKRLLGSSGYIRRSTILFTEALTTHFTHAFDFRKPNVALDLHWLLSSQAAHCLNYAAIWRQKQSFVLGNQHFFVLSDEYEVVFNLISIFKDIERGAARLKPFVDLYFILNVVNQRFDWETFLENRQREKILRISITILALFLEYFHCREQFPEVDAAIARAQGRLNVVPAGFQQRLMEASPGAFQPKVWAAGVYDCSRCRVFLWWLVSLPFRLAVYHPGKYGRFKNRVQQWKQRWWTRPGHTRETAQNRRLTR